MAAFDEHANAYDSWFMENENLLLSELKLVAHFLDKDSTILSVGCGSGLFEMLLAKDYDIHIKHGIEPSKDMAQIAEKRGLTVDINTAEGADIAPNKFDIIMNNGHNIPLAQKKAADFKRQFKIYLYSLKKRLIV